MMDDWSRLSHFRRFGNPPSGSFHLDERTSHRARKAPVRRLPTLRCVAELSRQGAPPSTRDTAPDLVRLVLLHAGLVALPVLVLGVAVVGLLAGFAIGVPLALVGAIAAGAVVTALRLRDLDARIATRIGAEPAPEHDHARLHGLAESVAMSVGVAQPRLFLIDTPARNAVTWGDGRSPLCLAFTTGLLDAVDRLQLEALLARQLTVARDGSVDVLTVAAGLFESLGALDGPVARIARHAVDDRAVVEADLEGVRATCFPPGMVAALETTQAGDSELPAVPRALSGACLATPGSVSGPFAVHPPLADRIDLLREL